MRLYGHFWFWALNGSCDPNKLVYPSISKDFLAESSEVQKGQLEGHMMLDLDFAVDEDITIGEVIDEWLDDCTSRNLASSSISSHRERLSVGGSDAPSTGSAIRTCPDSEVNRKTTAYTTGVGLHSHRIAPMTAVRSGGTFR